VQEVESIIDGVNAAFAVGRGLGAGEARQSGISTPQSSPSR
jgi:hypothetical protein